MSRQMYAKAQAAATETPPGPTAYLVDDFHKIGITENQLHLWASRGPVGGVREAPLLSPAAVGGAAIARRGGGGDVAAAAAAGRPPRSVDFWRFAIQVRFFLAGVLACGLMTTPNVMGKVV